MKAPTIFHVVPRRNLKDETSKARCVKAFDSWNWLYKIGSVVPVHVWKVERSATSIGDKRDLPYLKDVLNEGLKQSTQPSDIILFTNDDVILHPMILQEINRFTSLFHAGSMRRVEIDTRGNNIPLPPLYSNPVDFIDRGFPHIGRDAFVFHAGWLTHNFNLIPDFLLGAWGWDVCVACLIRLMRGHRTANVNSLYDNLDDCELPDGLVIHEMHESEWTKGTDWKDQPSNKHNQTLFYAWIKKFCPGLKLEAIEKHDWPKSVLIRSAMLMTIKKQTTEAIAPLL